MKIYINTVLLFTFAARLYSQNLTVEIDSSNVTGLKGLHSFAFATHGDYWVFIGGWKRGLHGFYPNNAFPNSGRNDSAFVYDRINDQWWSANLNQLPQSQYGALTSTNMQFHQRDTVLYIIGGYGWNYSTNAHETFPSLIGINIPSFVNAVINGAAVSQHCRQVNDPWFAVTGAHLERIGTTYYLVFGHRYSGYYNLNPAPSVQSYTEEIRMFSIQDNGINLSFTPVDTIRDTLEFHRRDFNLVPQIFPNHDTGFTAFTGVFQSSVDLPFLNCVDITSNGYSVTTGPDQYLNQYHTAVMPVYAAGQNEMHTYFFGGIGLYYTDSSSNLHIDSLVPFVSTISRMTRDSTWSLTEYIESERMPGYYGTNAHFIVHPDIRITHDKIILADSLPNGRTLVGWIYGGIHADAPNVAYNTNQSRPSNSLWEVYMNKGISTGIVETTNAPFLCSVSPVPSSGIVTIATSGTEKSLSMRITSFSGQIVWSGTTLGSNETVVNCSEWSSGVYFVSIGDENFSLVRTIIIE